MLGTVRQDLERATELIEVVENWPLRALPSDVAAAIDLLHAGRDLLILRAENLTEVLDDRTISPERLIALTAIAHDLAKVNNKLSARLAAAGKAVQVLSGIMPAAPAPGGLAS